MNSSSRLLRSSRLAALGFVLCAALHVRADETFQTSAGTFRLPEVASLQGSTALRSTLRTLELVSAAAAADARKAAGQLTSVAEAIQTHNAAVQDYLARVTAHNQVVESIGLALRAQAADVAVYESDCSAHNAAASASNALAPEQRDPATVAALNAEMARLQGRRTALENRAHEIDAVGTEANAAKARLDDEGAHLDERSQQLNERRTRVQATLGAAYRQLERCHGYSQEAARLAATLRLETDTDLEAIITDLSGTLERVKSIAGAGFDGHDPQAPNLGEVRPEFSVEPNGS